MINHPHLIRTKIGGIYLVQVSDHFQDGHAMSWIREACDCSWV